MNQENKVTLREVLGDALSRDPTIVGAKVDGKVYDVQFDDMMVLIDPQTMINRARVTKFGFEVGQVTLVFRRPAP